MLLPWNLGLLADQGKGLIWQPIGAENSAIFCPYQSKPFLSVEVEAIRFAEASADAARREESRGTSTSGRKDLVLAPNALAPEANRRRAPAQPDPGGGAAAGERGQNRIRGQLLPKHRGFEKGLVGRPPLCLESKEPTLNPRWRKKHFYRLKLRSWRSRRVLQFEGFFNV
jgi:hypothetical protein